MQSTGASGSAASPAHEKIWLLAPVLLFVLSVTLTQPAFIGDSFAYVGHIEDVLAGIRPVRTLWESGHILWRPLGYITAPLFVKLIPASLAWTPELRIGAGLIVFNLAGALICTVLIFDLSRRLLPSCWWALLPTLLFVWGDAVLAYSRSGTSYIPALALLVIGLWWQLTDRTNRASTVIGPACLFALAALIWLPYLLVIPAACCARKFIELSDARRKPFNWYQVLWGLVFSGIIFASGLFAAALLAGVRSVSEFAAWMTASGHGMQQNRQLIRAVSGCARLLLELSADGIYLKRFAFHDPYSPVGAFGLIQHSLGKIGLFYLFLAAVVLLAWLAPVSRRTLAPLALAAVPSFLFAVVVFEPSSPERFLPVLPFLLITLAAALGSGPRPALLLRGILCGFIVLLPVMNFRAFEPRLSYTYRETLSQLGALRQKAAPRDILVTVNMAEPAAQIPSDHPFDSFNRAGTFPTYWTVDPRSTDPAHWPARFARLVLTAWGNDRGVWIEKAALADRPVEHLLWTEGDNPQVHWRDVPALFKHLEYDADAGGSDGFLRISQTPANQERLLELSR